MLEIKNVNKYFNKGRKNQIHVIHNTTLSLSDKGLVALLGPSGCGKTTLLNTIGGLDKIKSGAICVDGKKISSRCTRKVDKIRNLNIGYIFQDYKLIENLSVFDNVALVLKMIGIKDKQEIKTRVEYVLDKVGMLRYKRRPAGMLSGGERQRVGIARAIVKSPNIILADEPTGNLDSKNTLEIMKIIKAISKERLVLLVTHEQDLAKFYASRIIEIEDGKVLKDYENNLDGELDYRQDNTFYLKDFQNHINLESKENEANIQIYSNQNLPLTLDIVLKNGNIYIQSKTPTKIEVVDENSSIEFIDEHYKKIAKKEAFQYQFDFDKLETTNIHKKYSSILNPISLLIQGFKRVLDFPVLKKILLVGFFLAGMFIMYSVSSIAASLTIKEEDFVELTKDYLVLKQGHIKIEDYLSYEQDDKIDCLLPGSGIVNFEVSLNDYYQTMRGLASLTGSLASIDKLNEKQLIAGRMPESDYEIVVDVMAINRMFENYQSLQMAGITKDNDLLDRNIKIKYMNDFKIVGITEQGSPSIYVNPDLFINIIANSANSEDAYYGYYRDEDISKENNTLLDYHLYQDKITLKKGRMPEGDYEVIVNHSNEENMPLNKEIDTKVNGKKLVVVGYYDSKEGYGYYLVNPNMIKYQTILTSDSIILSPKNKEEVLKSFEEKKLNIQDSYQSSKNKYLKNKQEEIKSTLIVSSIILAISLIEIFLMIRSSFLSRIKEIGIYRAIGVKKSDIYKMFTGEIIAITTLAGIPGLILMAYILYVLSGIKYLTNYIVINPPLVVLAIIFVYLFNLLIGLIPVYNTIKKRPAQILARYDLD